MLSFMRIAVGMLFLPINRTVTKTAHHQPIITDLPHTNIGLYLLKSFEASWISIRLVEKGLPRLHTYKEVFHCSYFQKKLDNVYYSSQPSIEWISLVNYLKDLLDLTSECLCSYNPFI